MFSYGIINFKLLEIFNIFNFIYLKNVKLKLKQEEKKSLMINCVVTFLIYVDANHGKEFWSEETMYNCLIEIL